MGEVTQTFSPDVETTRVVSHIDACLRHDQEIPEFYSSISNNNFYRENKFSDLVTISAVTPMPSALDIHYACASDCASFGVLPEIKRYYAIIDNKLFLWKFDQQMYPEQTMEEEKLITAVATFPILTTFFKESISMLLAIATPTYIKVIPIDNDKILFSTFYLIKTSFVPTSMTAGFQGQLFIGGSDNQIYLFGFLAPAPVSTPFSQFFGQTESFKLQNMTESIIDKYLYPSFLKFNIAPIKYICYNENSNLVAAIDQMERVYFYSYINESMSLLSKYNAPKGTNFVAINSVPISDSQFIRFICFTSKGERYYFGISNGFLNLTTKIALRGVRNAPPELSGKKIVDAFCSLGFTAIVTRNQIYVFRSQNLTPEDSYEVLGFLDLPGNGLAIGGYQHILTFLQKNQFNDPIIWQHWYKPPPAYVLTTAGGVRVDFQLPHTALKRMIFESNGQFDQDTFDYLSYYSFNDEGNAFALLIATLYPETRRNAIFLNLRFSRMQTQNIEPNPEHLTPAVHSFFMYIARQLNYIWYAAVFENLNGKWKVSPIVKQLPQDFVSKLNILNSLIDQYLDLSKITHEQISDLDEQREIIESEQLCQLKDFISMLTETLTFIFIISTQKSQNIGKSLDKLESKYRDRLTNEIIANYETKVPLVTALREFALQFFLVIDNQEGSKELATQISAECPTFIRVSDALITQAFIDLKKASRYAQNTDIIVLNEVESDNFFAIPHMAEQKKKEIRITKQQLIDRAVNVLLTYPKKLANITSVCSMLIQQKQNRAAVLVAIARAKSIDPYDLAYYWYKNGCDENDVSGQELFKQVSNCYEATFDAMFDKDNVGLDTVLSNGDELYQLTVFQKLLGMAGEHERLFNIKSPFLKDFLKENARPIYWKYFAYKKEYRMASEELIEIATDSENVDIEKRIQWLKKALNFAQSVKADDLVHQALSRIKCAKIQRRLGHTNEILFGFNDLLHEAYEAQKWDIVIYILCTQPYRDADEKRNDIRNAWVGFLFGITEENPIEINKKIHKVFKDVNIESDVFSTEIILPIFEDFRYERHLKSIWAAEILISCGIKGSVLYNSYVDLLKNGIPDDIPQEQKFEITYAAIWILDQGFHGVLEDIKPFIDEIVSSGDSTLYNPTKIILNRLNQ